MLLPLPFFAAPAIYDVPSHAFTILLDFSSRLFLRVTHAAKERKDAEMGMRTTTSFELVYEADTNPQAHDALKKIK